VHSRLRVSARAAAPPLLSALASSVFVPHSRRQPRQR
jgi:hypothetical protein